MTLTPIAWVITWTMKQSGPQASAYVKEDDARRAALNIEKYAHASEVTVTPAWGGADVSTSPGESGNG